MSTQDNNTLPKMWQIVDIVHHILMLSKSLAQAISSEFTRDINTNVGWLQWQLEQKQQATEAATSAETETAPMLTWFQLYVQRMNIGLNWQKNKLITASYPGWIVIANCREFQISLIKLFPKNMTSVQPLNLNIANLEAIYNVAFYRYQQQANDADEDVRVILHLERTEEPVDVLEIWSVNSLQLLQTIDFGDQWDVALLLAVKLVAQWLLAHFGCRVGRVGWLHLRDIELRIPNISNTTTTNNDSKPMLRVTIGTVGLRFTWQHLRWIHLAISDLQVAFDPEAAAQASREKASRELGRAQAKTALEQRGRAWQRTQRAQPLASISVPTTPTSPTGPHRFFHPSSDHDTPNNESPSATAATPSSSGPKRGLQLWWLAIRFSNWIGLTVERIQLSLMGAAAPDITVELDRLMVTTTFFQLGLRDGGEMLSFEGRVDLLGIVLKTHLLPDMPPTSLTSIDAFSIALSGKTKLEQLQFEQLELDIDLDKVDVNIRALLHCIDSIQSSLNTKSDTTTKNSEDDDELNDEVDDLLTTPSHLLSPGRIPPPYVTTNINTNTSTASPAILSLLGKVKLDIRRVSFAYALDEDYPDTSPMITVQWRSFSALFILPRLSEMGTERNGLMDVQMTACRTLLEDANYYPVRRHTLASINDISARLSVDFINTTLLRSRTSINMSLPKLFVNTNVLAVILSYQPSSDLLNPQSTSSSSSSSSKPSSSLFAQLSILPAFNIELRLNQPSIALSNTPLDDTDTNMDTTSTILICPDNVRLYGSLAPPASTHLPQHTTSTILSQLSGGLTIQESTITVQSTHTATSCCSTACCFTLPEAHLQWMMEPVSPASPLWPQRSLSTRSTYSRNRAPLSPRIDEHPPANEPRFSIHIKVHLDAVEVDLSANTLTTIGDIVTPLQSLVVKNNKSTTTTITSTTTSNTGSNCQAITVLFRVPTISVMIYGPGDPDDNEQRGICIQSGSIELQVEKSTTAMTSSPPPPPSSMTDPLLIVKGYLQSLTIHSFKPEVHSPSLLSRTRRRSSVIRPLSTVSNSNGHSALTPDPLLLSIETINFFTDATGSHQPVVCHIPSIHMQLTLLNMYAIVSAMAHLKRLASSSMDGGGEDSIKMDNSTTTTTSNVATTTRFVVELMAVHIDWQLANHVDLTFKLRCIRAHYSSTWYTDIESCRMYGYMSNSTPTPSSRVKLLSIQSLIITPNGLSVTPSNLSYISVSAASLCLSVPHKYRLADVIDNVNNTIKSAKYLWARVLTGGPPPHTDTHVDLPRLEIRIVDMVFELLDSPFEMALARIFRLGVPEQRERLVRETILESKLTALETDTAQTEPPVDPAVARYLLLEYNASRWASKIHNATTSNTGSTDVPLMQVTARDMFIKLGPPSFGRDHLAEWVYTLDQCTPADYIYDLGILMHLSWSVSELTMQLRDFPQPLIHFPPSINANDGGGEPSFVWEGDLAVLEQDPLPCAFRYVKVPITDRVTAISARTISPVKLFTDAHISVRNGGETRICWGPCIQPTLAELSHVIDTLTDPSPDPSPSLGWWDKLRLVLHGRLRLDWSPQQSNNNDEGGELHVRLQGGQHPWERNLRTAGLALVWRDSVSLTLGGDQRILEFRSKQFTIAIPDISRSIERNNTNNTNHSGGSEFAKVLLQLAGDVAIGIAGRLERPPDVSEWVPHHAIITRMSHSIPSNITNYDSFKGFRAGKVHLQFIFEAHQMINSMLSNSVHLTPKTVQHFLSFIELFGAEKSPPIRLGPLFPDITSKPPNFGKHLSSLRFTFGLSPFTLGYFIRDETTTTTTVNRPRRGTTNTAHDHHQHHHHDPSSDTATVNDSHSNHGDNYHSDGDNDHDDVEERHITLRGVKARVERFDFELVMEQYEKSASELPENSMMKAGFGIQDAMIDLIALDARSVTVEQVEYDLVYQEPLDIEMLLEEMMATHHDGEGGAEDGGDIDDEQHSHATVEELADDDSSKKKQQQNKKKKREREEEKRGILRSWMDMADLEDIDMPRIYNVGPTTQYLTNRLSMAGKDVRDIQLNIFRERQSVLQMDIARQSRLLNELHEHKSTVINTTGSERSRRRTEISRLKANLKIAAQQLAIIERHLAELEIFGRHSTDPSSSTNRPMNGDDDDQASNLQDSFDHRCAVHNAHIIWNIELRNQIFRYTRLLTRQHAIGYYMTATAVKAIRDTTRKIIRNNERALSIDHSTALSPRRQRNRDRSLTSLLQDGEDEGGEDGEEEEEEDDSLQYPYSQGAGHHTPEGYSPEDLIRQLLGDDAPSTTMQTLEERDKPPSSGYNNNDHSDNEEDDDDHSSMHPTVPDDYEVDHSLLVMFTYPQISLQSGNDNSTLAFLSAEQIQIESLSILDPLSEHIASNHLVKTRTILHVKDVQVFVAHRVHCMARPRSSLAFQYGSSHGRWQDWLPIDVLVDYDGESGPFQRIVSRASATLYHDKRNPLRFTAQASDESAEGKSTQTQRRYDQSDTEDDSDQGETVTDTLFIHLPSLVFSADALQFASIWSVANDLLAYREPDEHLDQINNILLASESNDYAMQEKIQGIEQVIERYLLDRKLWQSSDAVADRYSEEFTRLVDQHRSMREELYVIVTTMIRSQQLRERRRQTTKTVIRTVMTADRVVWLMVDDDSKDPLCECTLYHANLVWVIGDDQSSSNTLEIDRLEVIDRMPKAYFVELLYPLLPEGQIIDFTRHKMLRVHWRELAPVAGIAVVEHFEVNLFPCIVRLTQEVGRRIIAYAFPEKQRLRLHQESALQAKSVAQYRATVGGGAVGGGGVSDVLEEEPFPPSLALQAGDSATSVLLDTEHDGCHSLLREEPEAIDDPLLSTTSNMGVVKTRPARRLTLMADDDTMMAKRRRSKSIIRSATLIGNRQYRSLTQMRTRASENRTFIYVKVPSTQLCLSYRGRKEKDISNLNDFLFTLPTFEYRNKTCTSLDLLLQVKKDIMWRLLSHTGSLVKGKLFNSKPKHLGGGGGGGMRSHDLMALNTMPMPSPTDSLLLASASASPIGPLSSATGSSQHSDFIMNRARALLHVETGTTLKKRPSLLLRALSTQSEEGTDRTESEDGDTDTRTRIEEAAGEEKSDRNSSHGIGGMACERSASTSSVPPSNNSNSSSLQSPSHLPPPPIRRSISNDQKSRLLFGKLYHAHND
ncbi:golgi-body localization protein domain-containing protein [Syncephalis fuscata]|nr:golgi-body localization protein domain-containing protein [Syncephalis fuscata]